MNYFNQLLESYAKIKKRDFHPTIDEAKIRGQQVDDDSLEDLLYGSVSHIESLYEKLPPEQLKAGIPVTGKDSKNYTLYSDDRGIHVKGGLFGAGRHLFDPKGKFMQSSPKTKKDIVSAFGELQSTKKQAKDYSTEELEQMPQEEFSQLPGLAQMSPLMASPFPDQEAVVNFQKIKQTAITRLWDSLPNEFREKGPWGASDNEFSTYLAGGRYGSIESQLANAVSVTKDENNTYIEGATQPNPHMIRQISSNLLKFMEMAHKTNLTQDDRNLMSSFFGLDSKGRVCLFRDTTEEGLVITDSSGFMKNLLDLMKARHDVTFYKVDYPKLNDRTSNSLRGTMLEASNIFINLLNQAKTLNSATHQSLANKIYDLIFKNKIMEFAKSNYGWVYKASNNEAAVNLEDVPYYDELVKFFSKISVNLDGYLKGFVSAHKNTITRNPDLIIRKGHIIGLGRKSDLLELYSDYDRALEAATLAGVGEEAISFVTPDEIGQTDPILALEYSQAGLLTGPMYGLNISLKTLIDDVNPEVKLGSGRPSGVDKFLSGDMKGLDPDQHVFRSQLSQDLGFTPIEEGNIREIIQELSKRRNALGLPYRAITKTSKGKNVETTPLLDFILNYRRQFLRLSNIRDVDNNSLKRSIRSMLDGAEEKIKKYDDYGERVLEAIGRFHELYYIGKNKKDPKMKQYLASKIYAIGASMAPTVLEVRTLTKLESRTVNANTVLTSFLQEFLLDKKSQKFDFKITPKGIRISNRRDRSQYIDLNYYKSTKANTPSTTNNVKISKGLIDVHALAKDKLPITKKIADSIEYLSSLIKETKNNHLV